MKIYIVTKVAFPNGMATTNRIKCYARAIKEGGLDCEILICGCTEFDKNRIKNHIAYGTYKDIPFRYIGGTTTDTRPEYIRRAAQYFRSIKTEFYLKKHIKKGDILFMYMGSKLDETMRLIKIAKSKGAYCVCELCELPFGTKAETEHAVYMRKKTIEKQFPKLDGVISISDALLNMAQKYTLPSCKHIKVPILVDFNQYSLPNKSSLAETPYIFHSGTLTEQKDGILGMIEAFGKATNFIEFPVKFISTGNVEKSPHKEEIHRIIAQYHLEDKIIFTGYLTDEQLKDYLSKASMVIINKYKTQQNQYCFSTKLAEYLAAAKPVIITQFGEAMNWLKDKESAYIIEPENNFVLVNAIVYVFTHAKESREIGLEGQNVCRESFDYRNWSKPLVDFFNSLGK